MDGLQRKTLLKWMIWGYHYFRKHPYGCFLKWCYPHFTPHNGPFLGRKTHGFVGETHHFRSCPQKLILRGVCNLGTVVQFDPLQEEDDSIDFHLGELQSLKRTLRH